MKKEACFFSYFCIAIDCDKFRLLLIICKLKRKEKKKFNVSLSVYR